MIEAIETDVEHRPWPMPRLPWIMFQSWRDLLFAHWPVSPEALRPLVPAQLVLEEYDGSAWLGLTPFRLMGLRPRYLPALPGLSDFPEMNLRTYVRVGGKPGIFFFSLDAGSRLAVQGARTGFRLPYRHAEMRVERVDGWIGYRSRRDDGIAEFAGRYRPTGVPFHAVPDTLEHFLIERYALYTVLRNGRILRGDIHHHPWDIQPAEAEIERNTVASAHGITLSDTEPLLHFSARQDTLVWPPVLVP
jgi:uncharacterized protein YqjF (DUF2071 family)